LNRDEEVLLRFSIKEALYKAMHPLICQYVGFREAEVQPKDDGSVDITLDLKSAAHRRFGLVQAHWCRFDDFFLTSARIELNGERPDWCSIEEAPE
jgi:4'-phosphopantetheinyl transferase EntD